MKRLISLCVVGLLACLMLATVEPSATAQEQSAISAVIPELFHSGPRPAEFQGAADPTVVRSRTVRINIELLTSIKANDGFVFNLFEDATFAAVLEIIKNRDTWIGSIEGKPAGTFTLVMNDSALSAIIRVPGEGIYRVRSLRDGVVVIQEIDETRFPPCGVGPAQDGIPAGGGAAAGGGADCDDGSVIDVLVVYTQLARAAAGGTAAIETEIDLAIEAANIVYDNSLIATQINLVRVAEVDYDEAGSYQQHLDRLIHRSDGYMDNVHEVRDQYGADMVALIVDDSDSCGIAKLMRELSPDFEDMAFSVTTWFCAVGNLTFAHELGHNMGCHHDRENACSIWPCFSDCCEGNFFFQQDSGVYPYSFGYRNSDEEWRTVMAADCPGGCPRIQHFSNPDVLYEGQPTGVPLGDPYEAHDALTINQTALTVANFRCHVGDFVETFKLLANDGAADDHFGYSVAIGGTTAIVGAWADDDNGTNSGSAYLFDTTTGDHLFKLLPTDGAELDFFGVSVAIRGAPGEEIAIVGAFRDGDNGALSGSAYLFDVTTGRQIAKLLPDDGEAFDFFGSSVAISGTTAIVGASFDDENGDASGSAYLFDISDPKNPVQIAKLLPDDGAADDRFGISVAISGTTAIVGAFLDDDDGEDSGSAYLFDTTTGNQTAKLLPDDGAAEDFFGFSVAISGGIAIVGARQDDDNGGNSGSAYLFDTTTSRQLFKLLANDGAADDDFGKSVAISGATAIVGAWLDDDNGGNSGSAYLFGTATGAQIARLLPNDGAVGDAFGSSVAISGPIAIVGSRYDDDDDNGVDSGSAFVFDSQADPGDPGIPGDLDGDGLVGVSDLLILLDNWGPCGDCNDCPADLNGDCNVGVADLLILLANWG